MQQHLISHSESGSSGRLLWSARLNKDQILKSACLSNKVTQFQTKGGISDGALRVTYYDSRGFVYCSFIFHVADPTIGGGKGGGGGGGGLAPLRMISRRNYPSWSVAENRDKDRDTLIEQSL